MKTPIQTGGIPRPIRFPTTPLDFDFSGSSLAMVNLTRAQDKYIEKRIRELLPRWLAWAVLVRRWKLAVWLAGIRTETIVSPVTGSLEAGYRMTHEYRVTRIPLLKRLGGALSTGGK